MSPCTARLVQPFVHSKWSLLNVHCNRHSCMQHQNAPFITLIFHLRSNWRTWGVDRIQKCDNGWTVGDDMFPGESDNKIGREVQILGVCSGNNGEINVDVTYWIMQDVWREDRRVVFYLKVRFKDEILAHQVFRSLWYRLVNKGEVRKKESIWRACLYYDIRYVESCQKDGTLA